MNTQLPTPRTDAETQRLKVVLDAACTEGPWEAPICSVGVEFARDLERENEAMRAAIQEALPAFQATISCLNIWHNAAGSRCQTKDAAALASAEIALAALRPFLPA